MLEKKRLYHCFLNWSVHAGPLICGYDLCWKEIQLYPYSLDQSVHAGSFVSGYAQCLKKRGFVIVFLEWTFCVGVCLIMEIIKALSLFSQSVCACRSFCFCVSRMLERKNV